MSISGCAYSAFDMEKVMKRTTGLYKKMTLMAIAPIIVMGFVILFFCYFRFRQAMYDEARKTMGETAQLMAYTYDVMWPGDYSLEENGSGKYDLHKGGANITSDYGIIDRVKAETGCEVSLLYMDVRVHTTIMAKNVRIAGMSTNVETTQTVISNGQEAFYKDVEIVDRKYLVLYKPLKNSSGDIVGMIEIARSSDEMKVKVWKTVWPTLLISLAIVGLAVFISFKKTDEIVDVIRKLQRYLAKVAGGTLTAEPETELLRRQDELGDMVHSSVEMTKRIRTFIETDPLTGLNNRRYVSYTLDKIRDRSIENGRPFCVAIGDIDFFKKVNDTYGHNAGDDVLKAVAAQLKEFMKARGFVARWGGEEFVMVFDNCGIKEAERLLNMLRENIQAMTVHSTEGFDIKVTMTYGVVNGIYDTVEGMVERADNNLYNGKQNGRNQVVASEYYPKEETETEEAETEEVGTEEAETVEIGTGEAEAKEVETEEMDIKEKQTEDVEN